MYVSTKRLVVQPNGNAMLTSFSSSDGTIDLAHTYPALSKEGKDDQYIVKISGGVTGFHQGLLTPAIGSTQANHLTQIQSWGTGLAWRTMDLAFAGCSKLASLPEHQLPNVNSFASAFIDDISLKTLPQVQSFFPPAMINGTGMFKGTGLSVKSFRALSSSVGKLKIPSNLAFASEMFYTTNLSESQSQISGCFDLGAIISSYTQNGELCLFMDTICSSDQQGS